MARIRTIKPEFWTDDALTECSLSARLLFIGTWNFADDNGNLERSAKQLKVKIFPADCVDVEPLVQELIKQKLLVEYSAGGKKYLHIRTFKDHQVINRPSKTALPLYDHSLNTHGVITEDSGTEGKGREGKGIGEEEEQPLRVSEISAMYQKYAGVNVTSGGLVTVLQDLAKNYSRTAITEAFEAAASRQDITSRGFLNWCRKRLERGGEKEDPLAYLDDLETA